MLTPSRQAQRKIQASWRSPRLGVSLLNDSSSSSMILFSVTDAVNRSKDSVPGLIKSAQSRCVMLTPSRHAQGRFKHLGDRCGSV